MAETTDRPQVPPDAILPGETLSAPPPAPADSYQPLSLMAMASFALAVVYTLTVLIGGVFSFLGHKPWLMPYWTFLIPIAVLIVCRTARTRIVNSERTLSGLAFTTWGSRLVILASIPYAAYYFATFLAVRGPAIDCANDFFQKIKDDQLEQLFLMSKDIPTKGTSSTDLHNAIESRFNQPPSGMSGVPGEFTRFRQERFVRFIQMDGKNASIVPTGVALWEYSKGGYHVVLTYHIATSLAEYDMNVDTIGRDPKPGEAKSRQYQVLLVRSETQILEETVKLTQQGREFQEKTAKAKEFAQDLAAKISDVAALTVAEQGSYSKGLRGLDTFWAGSPKLRDQIAQHIRNTFRPTSGGKKFPINFNLQPSGIPFLRESDGRTTALIDTTIRFLDESGVIPQYVVDGRLVISAETSAAANSSSAWRFEAIEIENGRTAPEMRRMMQRMGTPLPEEGGPEGGQRMRLPDAPPPPPVPGAGRRTPP